MDPALNGSYVFGTACKCVHTPLPNAAQEDSFFGITGVVRLDGGGRGRMFHIHGVFVEADIASVLAAELVLLSYADGIARTFTDTMGRSWANTIVTGEYQPDPAGPKPTVGGWCLPYRCTLRCLG